MTELYDQRMADMKAREHDKATLATIAKQIEQDIEQTKRNNDRLAAYQARKAAQHG